MGNSTGSYGQSMGQPSYGQQPYGQSMGQGQQMYGGMGGQYSPQLRQQGPTPQGMPYGGSNPISGAMGGPSGMGYMQDRMSGLQALQAGGQNAPGSTYSSYSSNPAASNYWGGSTAAATSGLQNQQQQALATMRAGDVNGGISGVAGGVAGSQYQQPMRSGQSQPMGGPAPQAFANASPQASFMRGNDFATKQHDPYGGFTVPGAGPAQANPMASSMSGMGGVTGGPSQVQNKMAQTSSSAIPGYGNPMPGANPGLTIDPRTMGFMQAWGGYGNYGQAANQYNQDYWARFPGGQAPGGPMNYTPQNWDFNNGIG